MQFSYLRLLLALPAIFFCHMSVAGVSVDTTRVVYDAAANVAGKRVGITSNSDSDPAFLVKTLVTSDPEGTKGQPFFHVSPSLFRLEPGSTSQVRVLKKAHGLATDKESVFYLRFIAMPSGDGATDSDRPAIGGALQVATGQVIKLFYRPDNLSVTQKQAMGMLTFRAMSDGLELSNPTPYYITLQKIKLDDRALKFKMGEGSSMVAPYSKTIYPNTSPKGRKISWVAINDFGGAEEFNGFVR